MSVPAGPAVTIRAERPSDGPAITALNDAAFGGPAEGKLIIALRRRADFIPDLSLVALTARGLTGHIMFSPLPVAGRKHRVLALAPMAVMPGWQKKGIGSALVRAGLARAAELGFDGVIVLGHPGYYPRFGFAPASSFGLVPPVAEWEPAFFALALRPGALARVAGRVDYPPEFSAV